MNDQDKINLARDDFSFRVEVLTSLTEIKAQVTDACKDLDLNREAHLRIYDKIEKHGKDIAELKVKSGIFGAVTGLIGGFMAGLMKNG